MLGQNTKRPGDGRIVVRGRSSVVLCIIYVFVFVCDDGERRGMVKEGEKEQGRDRGRREKKK